MIQTTLVKMGEFIMSTLTIKNVTIGEGTPKRTDYRRSRTCKGASSGCSRMACRFL
jgi:hypothetical protein